MPLEHLKGTEMTGALAKLTQLCLNPVDASDGDPCFAPTHPSLA
jgi:hypothetical protein